MDEEENLNPEPPPETASGGAADLAPEAPAPAPGANASPEGVGDGSPSGWAAAPGASPGGPGRADRLKALMKASAARAKAWIAKIPPAGRAAIGVSGALLAAAAILVPMMKKRPRPAAIGVAAHFLPAARPAAPATPLPRPPAVPAFGRPPAAAAAPKSAPAAPNISKSAEEAAKDLMAVVASETLQAIRAAQPAATAPVDTLYTAGDFRDPFSKTSASDVVQSRPFDPAKDVSLDDLSLVGILRGPKSSEALFADKRFGVNLILRWGRLYYSGGRSGLRRGRSVLGTSIPGVTGAIMSKQGVVLRRGVESRVFVLGSKVVVLGGSGRMASL